MLTKDELDALKLGVDPISLLLHLGFDIKKETHKELRGPCIIHGGDNASAFRFNKNTNTWVCFTNKCNETVGNDIIGLIMAAKRLSFQEALLFLADFVGDSNITASDVIAYKRRKDKQAFIRNTGVIHKHCRGFVILHGLFNGMKEALFTAPHDHILLGQIGGHTDTEQGRPG